MVPDVVLDGLYRVVGVESESLALAGDQKRIEVNGSVCGKGAAARWRRKGRLAHSVCRSVERWSVVWGESRV